MLCLIPIRILNQQKNIYVDTIETFTGLMRTIALKPGELIVFGGRQGMGLSRLTIKIANELALSSNVLFVSYQTYKEKILKTITEQGSRPTTKLIIDTTLPFNFEAFYHLREIIKSRKANYVFVDDLDSFMGADRYYFSTDEIIKSFHQLVSDFKVTIVLNLTVSGNSEKRSGSHKPLLRDFDWARNIIELADQIYSIYRPAYYGLTQDENGDTVKHIIEINCLKNARNEIHLIKIDNRKEKILLINQPL
jgi:replicative DNA helicase